MKEDGKGHLQPGERPDAADPGDAIDRAVCLRQAGFDHHQDAVENEVGHGKPVTGPAKKPGGRAAVRSFSR